MLEAIAEMAVKQVLVEEKGNRTREVENIKSHVADVVVGEVTLIYIVH